VERVSLSLNSGIPYIAFIDTAAGYAPSVMSYSGGSWAYLGSPDFSSTQLGDIALAFVGTSPFVALGPSTTGTVTPIVMNYTGGAWQTVDGSALSVISYNGAGAVQLADLSNSLFLSYYAQEATTSGNTTNTVVVFSLTSGAWTEFPVGTMSTPFAFTVDPNGKPIVAYADYQVQGRLTVATP
jgi:hypothetical protein